MGPSKNLTKRRLGKFSSFRGDKPENLKQNNSSTISTPLRQNKREKSPRPMSMQVDSGKKERDLDELWNSLNSFRDGEAVGAGINSSPRTPIFSRSSKLKY